MSPLPNVETFPALHPSYQSGNQLLGALPPDEYQRLSPSLNFRPLKLRQILQKNGERISEVYFPARCVCSITSSMEDGGVVEVAMVGREGLVGIGAALGDPLATGDAVVQVQAEGAQAMNIETFRHEMERRGPFYEIVNRYAQVFVGLVMQSVACNGLHSAEERCCRWLLMTRDRVERNEFPLTHELLAVMLGVRRPTVTLVLAQLQRAGIVSHVRGQVRIVDGEALENASCECYKTTKALFSRLLTDVA